MGELVDERSRSGECVDDPGSAAVARLGKFPKVADRLEQCNSDPCVVTRVARDVAGRLSFAELRIDRRLSSTVLLVSAERKLFA